MSEPRLLFGLGATKAGTSWLHDYLSNHPECAMPYMKELHFFDTIEDGSLDWRLKFLSRKEADLVEMQIEAHIEGRLQRVEVLAKRIAELQRYVGVIKTGDPAQYSTFMQDLRDNQALVGDITPSYALLPAARLTQMAKMGPAVRFIYLLRDPVDRLWSNVRMIAQRKSKGGDPAPIAHRIFDDVIAGRDTDNFKRSDYRAALTRLAQAVPGPQVLVEFFETLFTETAMRRVCGFLGLTYTQPAFAKAVHKGKVPLALDNDRRRAARAFLAPQYDHVSAHLGDVPERWQRGDF